MTKIEIPQHLLPNPACLDLMADWLDKYDEHLPADDKSSQRDLRVWAKTIRESKGATVSPTNPRPIDYAALGSMMFDLPRKYISGEKDCEIHCPCFGAGLAGGNWDFIELLIHDAWIRQGLPVTVYQLEGQEVREPTDE